MVSGAALATRALGRLDRRRSQLLGHVPRLPPAVCAHRVDQLRGEADDLGAAEALLAKLSKQRLGERGVHELLDGPGGCWSSLATLGPALSPDPDQELGTTTCASDDQILGGGGLR